MKSGHQKPIGTIVKSVQKSSVILKYIIQAGGEVSLSEIQKDVGYNISTTHHLIRTLLSEGLISQNSSNKKYYMGPEIFFSWLRERKPQQYFSRAEPFIKECVNITNETTNLFIWDQNEAECITGFESKHTLRAFLKIGRKVPLHCTAAGKAFLMHKNADEIYNIFNSLQLVKYMPNTIVDLDLLIEELEVSRKRGYSVEMNEYEDGITAMGVPIFDHNGRVICAICSIVPNVRMDEEKSKILTDTLKNSAKKITKSLADIYYQ